MCILTNRIFSGTYKCLYIAEASTCIYIHVYTCIYMYMSVLKLSELVSEVQVRKFGKFLEEYASQLKDVENALEESNGDSWDLMLDPVAIEV